MFSYYGETVLDPFLGSGTTSKVAKRLNRNSVGYEIIRDLETVIRKKIDFVNETNPDIFEVVERGKGKYRFVSLDYIKNKSNENNS